MEKRIRRVILVVNLFKEEARGVVEEMKAYFRSRSIEATVFPVNDGFTPNLETGIDLAVTIGGDGTLLYCARFLAGADIPILAVNLGDFGFITEVSKTEWREALDKYLCGRLDISRRLLFEASVWREGRVLARFQGLNDAVIRTSGISKIIRLRVYLSRTYVGRYRADGLIVATPTGSTAYSMAAGGPILHPEMEAFILNPICPFTLSNRPMVIPGNETLEVEVEKEQRGGVVLLIDGQDALQLLPEDRVILCKSDKRALIIHSGRRNFYEVLRAKLNWAGEPSA